jgi:hypothetical protein
LLHFLISRGIRPILMQEHSRNNYIFTITKTNAFHPLQYVTIEIKIYHTLRIASAMCLIGHGAFGIITKAVWCNYLAVVGIDQIMAYQLMPVIGTVDIIMGISLLFFPIRAVLLWLVLWGFSTAAMRPLSGEPFAELLERAGNFGAPLALLFLCPKARTFKEWFQRFQAPRSVSGESIDKVIYILRIIAFLFLIGHGFLNLIGKKGLLAQYGALGFTHPLTVGYVAGTIEVAAGVLFIAVRPLRPSVLFFLFWKVGTELFYPQWAVLEWVERGGSYGTLVALWFALKNRDRSCIR